MVIRISTSFSKKRERLCLPCSRRAFFASAHQASSTSLPPASSSSPVDLMQVVEASQEFRLFDLKESCLGT